MKRLAAALFFFFALCAYAEAAGCTGTGNCYWIGGTGNTSDTTRWATTDGGSTTGGVPGSGDNCNFTANSNTTAYTVTVDATANCKDMTWALPSVSGVPTLAPASGVTLNIFGSSSLVSGMVVATASGTSTLNYAATATGKTVTSNGVVIGTRVNVTFNGVGGGWTLQDDLSINVLDTITVSAGTLNTNAKTVTAGFFVSTSGTRALTLTNSTINITGTSGTPWNVSTAGTLTFTATGSTINVTGGTANTALTLALSTVTYAAFNITGTGQWGATGAATFSALSYTATSDKRDFLSFNGNHTIAASGSLTLAGNSVVNRAFIKSNSLGSQRSISVPNTATVSITNTDFQDIASAGTFGTWTGTSLGDALGNSGITFDGSTTQTYAGGGGNWSTAALWTSRVPLPQDDVVLPASSAGTLTADMPRMGRNITATNFDKTLSFASVANSLFGNIALGSGGTFSGTQALTLQGRGAQTITSNTKSFPQGVVLQAFGGTYTQQDNFTVGTNALTLTNGTWADGGFTLGAANILSAGALTRAINASGTWSLSGGNGTTPWNVAATLTITAAPTIKLTGNISTNATFAGAGLTYGRLWYSSTTAVGQLIVTGANTFGTIQVDTGGIGKSITFPAATVNTIGALAVNGTSTAPVTIKSATGASATTLRSRFGGPFTLNYATVQDIAALPTPPNWLACNSTNVSGNTGITFGGAGCTGFPGSVFVPARSGSLLQRDLGQANDNQPVGLAHAA